MPAGKDCQTCSPWAECKGAAGGRLAGRVSAHDNRGGVRGVGGACSCRRGAGGGGGEARPGTLTAPLKPNRDRSHGHASALDLNIKKKIIIFGISASRGF